MAPLGLRSLVTVTIEYLPSQELFSELEMYYPNSHRGSMSEVL